MLKRHPKLPLFVMIVVVTWVTACQTDQLLDSRVAQPAGPRFDTWVDRPQPCIIGTPFVQGQTWIGWSPQKIYSACGVNVQMYWPPGNTFNGNYGAWFTDYEGLVVGDSLTQFKVNFNNNFQEGPLEINFNKAVKNVSVTLDACYQCTSDTVLLDPGHHMVALDSAGNQLGRVDFDAGMRISQKTLAFLQIRKVVVYPVVFGPAPGGSTSVEKVQQRVAFAVDSSCPPSGDSVLDSKDFLDGLKQALANSNPNATPGSGVKKERGGVVWRDSVTGKYSTQDVIDPNATECTYNSGVLTQVLGNPPTPNSVPIGKYHTHPSGYLEKTFGCVKGQPSVWRLANPDNPKDGGGSPDDWAATADTYPNYVITKTGRIYRLDQQWANNKSKNPNKWQLNTNPGCPTKIP